MQECVTDLRKSGRDRIKNKTKVSKQPRGYGFASSKLMDIYSPGVTSVSRPNCFRPIKQRCRMAPTQLCSYKETGDLALEPNIQATSLDNCLRAFGPPCATQVGLRHLDY